MAENKRTNMCGLISKENVGKTVVLKGWVARRRELGSIIFVFLRDRTGIVQVLFDSNILGDKFEQALQLRNEFVVSVTGEVRLREQKDINPKLATGEVEVVAKQLTVLAASQTPPFVVDEGGNVNEALRYKYRYLDLRRNQLQQNIMMRAKLCKAVRDYLTDNGFLEIETPYLGKSTPEGARDYLVPSRVHDGKFYALAQSPQLYKQLLMLSGFDRYYQIVRCFRDEDLRGNRQPEFTQIDIEMSFAEKTADVTEVIEGMVKHIFDATIGLKLTTPFKTLTYDQAMSRYGSDKPDTRFGMEIVNVSDLLKNTAFKVFGDAINDGGSVRLIKAEGCAGTTSRREIDEMTELVKTYKASGLAWIARDATVRGSVLKVLSQAEIDGIFSAANAKDGDIVFIVADKNNDTVLTSLGELRLHLGKKLNLVNNDVYDILWVKEFPLLEFDQEENRYAAKHHPFTSPMDEDLHLLESQPQAVRAKAYDLVINGMEAGGGSIRIHTPEMQKRVFKALSFDEKQIEEKFGFFIDAFNYGAPPHGGIAFGLERLTMLLCKTDNIKDVIAFPKMQNACCAMTQAPAEVTEQQLNDLHICIKDS